MQLGNKTKKVKPKGKRGRKPTSKIISIKPDNKKVSDNLDLSKLPYIKCSPHAKCAVNDVLLFELLSVYPINMIIIYY